MTLFVDAVAEDAAYTGAWARLRAVLDAESADLAAVAAAAPDFPALVAARFDTLHQALRGLGLAAPDLAIEGARYAELAKTAVRLVLTDRATGREVTVDVTRSNGNAFLSGRRYESALTRVSLSDAEIAATSVLRLDVDHAAGMVLVTFMTLDARPCRLVFLGEAPDRPRLEGTLPPAALTLFRKRQALSALAVLAQRAQALAEADGALRPFVKRLFSRRARIGRRDWRLLAPVAAARAAVPLDRPLDRPLAEVLLRRLTVEDPGKRSLLVHALVAFGVGALFCGEKTPSDA